MCRHLRPLPDLYKYIGGELFGPILRRLFFRRLLRRVVRILLCAAFINADAVSNSNTVIKAFLETDAGPDDGATDVVHAFGPA